MTVKRMDNVGIVVEDLEMRWPGSASVARSWLARWCNMKTCTGSAISAALKAS